MSKQTDSMDTNGRHRTRMANERNQLQRSEQVNSRNSTPEVKGAKASDHPVRARFGTVPIDTKSVNSLVGVDNAERRVVELAHTRANDGTITQHRFQLESRLAYLNLKLGNIKNDLKRLLNTKGKIPRLKRHPVSANDQGQGKRLSLAKTGDSLHVLMWFLLFVFAGLGEISVGAFNILRAGMEGATVSIALIMGFVPFAGTFSALAWLDPGDVDRNRHPFYMWLTRIVIVVTPVGMFLLASKLDSLLATDWSDSSASTGPSYRFVIWTMQISFALAIYLFALKLSDAWYHLIGYEVRETDEFAKTCKDIESCEQNFKDLMKAKGIVVGGIQAIDARKDAAIADYKACFDQCRKSAEKQRRIAEARAAEAAARARLEAEREADEDTDLSD